MKKSFKIIASTTTDNKIIICRMCEGEGITTEEFDDNTTETETCTTCNGTGREIVTTTQIFKPYGNI